MNEMIQYVLPVALIGVYLASRLRKRGSKAQAEPPPAPGKLSPGYKPWLFELGSKAQAELPPAPGKMSGRLHRLNRWIERFVRENLSGASSDWVDKETAKNRRLAEAFAPRPDAFEPGGKTPKTGKPSSPWPPKKVTIVAVADKPVNPETQIPEKLDARPTVNRPALIAGMTKARLRGAVVWSEILAPPVSLRDE